MQALKETSNLLITNRSAWTDLINLKVSSLNPRSKINEVLLKLDLRDNKQRLKISLSKSTAQTDLTGFKMTFTLSKQIMGERINIILINPLQNRCTLYRIILNRFRIFKIKINRFIIKFNSSPINLNSHSIWCNIKILVNKKMEEAIWFDLTPHMNGNKSFKLETEPIQLGMCKNRL